MRPLEISSPSGRARIDPVHAGWVIELDEPVDETAATHLLTEGIRRTADFYRARAELLGSGQKGSQS